MLHPQIMMGSFGDFLEMEEGAFMMFGPRGEGRLGGQRGGVSSVCHCDCVRVRVGGWCGVGIMGVSVEG